LHVSGLLQAFGNTSNPQHLLRSRAHAEALTLLSAVPEDGRNIRVLIGDPGMGKTILLLHLLEELGDSALTAHLFWTQLGRDEFIRYFCHEFGLLDPPHNIADAQEQFAKILEQQFRQHRRVVIAIDEAHNLEIPVLCGLAELLRSAEARDQRMSVILAGLPQLALNLASPEVEEIPQRISAVASLTPLTVDETAVYIHRRLEVAGYSGDGPFTSEALSMIATLAQGVPRNINNLCFAVLYLAGRRQSSVIDPIMVLEASEQWEGRLVVPTAPASASLGSNRDSEQDNVPAVQEESAFKADSNSLTHAVPAGEEVGIALPDSICQWFGNHRVAWSGTVGELAAALDRPETEVARALTGNSETLRSSGIDVSECQDIGRARLVCLRRIENKPAGMDRITAVDGLSDYTDEANQVFNGASAGHFDGRTEPVLKTEAAAEEGTSVSATEQVLDLLPGTPAEYFEESHPWGLRWPLVALLILLALWPAWKYATVFERNGYSSRTDQQFDRAKKLRKVTPPSNSGDSRSNLEASAEPAGFLGVL
jgi:type II secretory pathway predicted ATPase ExeA